MKDTVAEMWRKPRVCGRVAAPGSHVQNNRQTRPLSRDTATSGTTNSPFVVRSHALYQFLWFCDTHHSVTWPTFLPMFDSSHLSISGHYNDLENELICDGSSSITYFFGRNSRNDRLFSSILRMMLLQAWQLAVPPLRVINRVGDTRIVVIKRSFLR